MKFLGHRRHDGVDARNGKPQGTTHVADRRPRRQRAEGADLGHRFVAVGILDVLNHLAAALLLEIDVDIGSFLAAFVEKTLEEQIILERADVAQKQRISHQRPYPRTARRRLDPLAPREVHVVPHNEKVVGKTELVDHPQLAFQPIEHFPRRLAVDQPLGIVRIAPLQTLHAQLAEIVFRRLALGWVEDRKMPLAQLQLDLDAIGDLLAPPHRVFQPRKRRVHLLRPAKIKLLRLHPHPLDVGAELARVHAQQNVLGRGVAGIHVVHVARGDHGQLHPPGHFHGGLGGNALDLQPVVLYLNVVAIAEHPAKPLRHLHGLVDVRNGARQERSIQLARHAAAQADQPFAVGFQQLLVDPRSEIESLQKRGRRQLEKIAESGLILRKSVRW